MTLISMIQVMIFHINKFELWANASSTCSSSPIRKWGKSGRGEPLSPTHHQQYQQYFTICWIAHLQGERVYTTLWYWNHKEYSAHRTYLCLYSHNQHFTMCTNALLHNCTPPQCIVPYFAILCNVHTTQCIVHIIIFVSEVIVTKVGFSCSNGGGGGEAGGVCTTLLLTQLHNQPPQKWSRRRNYETALNALL